MNRCKKNLMNTAAAVILLSAFSQTPVYANSTNPPSGLGLPVGIVTESAKPANAFPVVGGGRTAELWHDANDYKGVIRAIGDLQADIGRVTDRKAQISTKQTSCRQPIIIGTLGHSALIDTLVANGKLDDSDLKGKWESFVITTIDDPVPGVKQALVIAGSDKRGTIYGIYELSEQLGVSPWYWWADVPPKKRAEAFVVPGRYVSDEPVVKYRGIFINDEEPAFGPWAREKFGGINSKMYTHMFELILRLRGNYLWPAMWGKAFNEDDPMNPVLANEYGIVMGTSHHEPMMRAQQEWTKRKANIGNGQWNYYTNEDGLADFWKEGMERNKDYDNLVTVGMRGDGDEPMVEGGSMDDNVKLLERIVADQRKILEGVMKKPANTIPQMWALYKEVKDYYDHGMEVPDDITLLWCDDNWGNIRRLPTPEEQKRSGGAGIYYHFDYVGSPRCYKWVNHNPLPKVWEQMNMAHEYGANQIWVVNVGDLKPMELPIEFFLRMAWNPKAMPKEKIAEFTRKWAEREFGAEHADAIADIVKKYAKYSAWRKTELLEPDTFSFVNYLEAERVDAAWKAIREEAERINDELPPEYRDAYFQLVLHPTKALATVSDLYTAVGRNRLYAAQGRASANDQAQLARDLFQLDQELTDAYHQVADGKWNHMMAQTHIGYTSWRDPKTNIMPEVKELEIPAKIVMGVAVEGSESAWPGESQPAVLPTFDSLNQQKCWIDVFKRGSKEFSFNAGADQPWVKLSATSGSTELDQRLWVGIDWNKVPVGEQSAKVKVASSGEESVTIQVNTVRSDTFTRENIDAFGGLTGPTAFAAESATKNIAAGGVRWERIPDYGRGASGMAAFPITEESIVPSKDSARMEYRVFIAEAGDIQVDLVTGISLKVQPDRGVRVAVSFDAADPQILDAFDGQDYADPSRRGDPSSPPIRDWAKWVKDNARTLTSMHKISAPGVHTLKVWVVDPGMVLEKIVVHDGNIPASYFGPPEASRVDQAKD